LFRGTFLAYLLYAASASHYTASKMAVSHVRELSSCNCCCQIVVVELRVVSGMEPVTNSQLC